MRKHSIWSVWLSGLTSTLMLSACQPEQANSFTQDQLPAEAIAAFQSWVTDFSEGEVFCATAAIDAAPRVAGLINDDLVVDYAMQPGLMRCETRSGQYISTSFFCSYRTCSFPALMSDEAGWHVESLMSGNRVESYVHYQEARFRVSQPDFSDPRGETIIVREYAWRDGRFQRISMRRERVSEGQISAE